MARQGKHAIRRILQDVYPCFSFIPRTACHRTHSALEDGDHALPQMVKKSLPPGMIGLMFSAFLAGLMSTIDSMLNSTATLWTKDIYEKFFKKDAPDSHYLFVGKLVTVVILLFGIATAPVSSYFPGIHVAIQTFLSFFQGPVSQFYF